MDTKLTLSLDETIISKAKLYAKKNNTSLSNLVENYLNQLTSKEKKGKQEISDFVKSLAVIKRPVSKKQRRDEYTEYLEKKHK